MIGGRRCEPRSVHRRFDRVAARTNVQVQAQDRRILIAEAALELLAREGARGLTHRAVDRELELPDGSTSYYYSTRAALLLAAAERLTALDMADVDATPENLDGVAGLVERWLSPAHRTRSVARVELLLTAARDPAFRFMQKARSKFIERAGHGSTSVAARTVGLTVTALADGLLLHGLVTGRLSRRELRTALEQIAPAPATVAAAPTRAARATKRPRSAVRATPLKAKSSSRSNATLSKKLNDKPGRAARKRA